MQRSWHATLLGAALVVALAAGPALGGGAVGDGVAATPEGGFEEPAPLQTGDVEPDGVSLRVAVAADGDARWQIEYRVRLDDENRTAAFESLQRDVRTNESRYREQFAARMERTVATAENATGREMAVRNVTVTATTQELGRSYGVVTYRFAWTGFAAVEGDRLRVGDAIAGLFVDADTRLEVTWPEGYEATTVRPPPDERTDRTVVWTGPADFGPDRPSLVAAPAGGSGGGTGLASLPVLGAVAVVAVAAGGGFLWWRRERGRAAGGGSDDDVAAGGRSAAGDGGDGESPDAAEGTGDGAGSADEEPSLELLSPEERVLRVVSEHGGRVKQQQIVSELDWSAARTSQVVGSLRDDGRVETFRLGRENVVRLPAEDEEEVP